VEGVPAIRQALSEGINITLLFAQQRYEEVAEAFLAGLEDFAARGGDLHRLASVASFFVSRIDTLVDSIVEQKLKKATTPSEQALLESIPGKHRLPVQARARWAAYEGFDFLKDLLLEVRWKPLFSASAAEAVGEISNWRSAQSSQPSQ
jgi:transaldolase/glucose-6-phosphate isomerase